MNDQCLNPAYPHPNFYGQKYGGYCLDCANAGVPGLLEEIERLRGALASLDTLPPDGSVCGGCGGGGAEVVERGDGPPKRRRCSRCGGSGLAEGAQCAGWSEWRDLGPDNFGDGWVHTFGNDKIVGSVYCFFPDDRSHTPGYPGCGPALAMVRHIVATCPAAIRKLLGREAT